MLRDGEAVSLCAVTERRVLEPPKENRGERERNRRKLTDTFFLFFFLQNTNAFG